MTVRRLSRRIACSAGMAFIAGGLALRSESVPAAGMPVISIAQAATAVHVRAPRSVPVLHLPMRSAILRKRQSAPLPVALLPHIVATPPARGISPDVLARLVGVCAPHVDPVIQSALVSVESGGDAWALRDDNDGRTYAPATFAAAVTRANALIASDRSRYGANDRGIDVGLGQINSNNFAMLGTDAATMLDPCSNLGASSRMIVDAYRRERSLRDRDPVLHRALSIYNSGRPSGDERYVSAVLDAADPPTDTRQPEAATAAEHEPGARPSPRIVRATPAPKARAVAQERADAPAESGLFVHVDVPGETPPPSSAP